MVEEWRDIAGYEGIYQVSNQGRVMSLERSRKYRDGGRKQRGMILSQSKRTSGSLGVYLCKDSKKRNLSIDKLVASAFLPERSDKERLIHVNGDISDNRAENLAWAVPESSSEKRCRKNMERVIDFSVIDDMPSERFDGEEWRDIEGLEEAYQVSDYGRVRSKTILVPQSRCGVEIMRLVKGRILKQQVDRYGYLYVNLGGRNRKVHRLVMENFVGKSNLTVNHKDEDKTNNRLENLEYMTVKDNLLYGTGMDRRRVAARKRGKPVEQIDMNTGAVVKRYEVLVDVDEDGFCSQSVGKACMGKIPYSGGYYWRYSDVKL